MSIKYFSIHIYRGREFISLFTGGGGGVLYIYKINIMVLIV